MANRQASVASPSPTGFTGDDNPGGIPTAPLATVNSRASATGARLSILNAHSTDEHNEKHNVHHADRRLQNMDDESLKDVSMNAMGRLYGKIVGFSVITRHMVYVVPVGVLLAAPLMLLPLTGHKDDIRLGTNDGAHGPPLFYLFLWVQISWLSLWSAKVAAVWLLPHLFMFFCGIVSAGTRKYVAVLNNLNVIISTFFWSLASWLTFKTIFAQAYSDGIAWVVNLERVLGACFVSCAILLGEKTIVQLIGVSYHQRSLESRIKSCKRETHLLGLLYDASRTLFPMRCNKFSEQDGIIEDSIEMMLRRKDSKSGVGSVSPETIIDDVSRLGDKMTSVFGNLVGEITGRHVFNPNSAHFIVVEALEKKRSSEALARRLWMSFVAEGRDALCLDDVENGLGPAYKAEAKEAFEAIDTDANGDISLEEMLHKVVEMSKERKAISEGMKDIGQALIAFDKVLLFVVLLITCFVFLSFFHSSLLITIATAGTALLSLSFVFAVTAQEFLGSCIFLFVKHPYDVGDRIEISGTQMLVDRISLLYTVFTRTDRMQMLQVPNIVLNNLWIDNITRSKAMLESFAVDVPFDTSFRNIELLRERMENFVHAPENSRDFHPDFSIGVDSVNNLDKLTLKFTIKHKSNWHNDRVRATRHSKFMCALAVAMNDILVPRPGGGGELLGGPTNPS